MPLDVYNSAVQLHVVTNPHAQEWGLAAACKQRGQRRLPLVTAWKTAFCHSTITQVLGMSEESGLSYTDLAAQLLLKTHTDL